jgi:hypothetical protein
MIDLINLTAKTVALWILVFATKNDEACSPCFNQGNKVPEWVYHRNSAESGLLGGSPWSAGGACGARWLI